MCSAASSSPALITSGHSSVQIGLAARADAKVLSTNHPGNPRAAVWKCSRRVPNARVHAHAKHSGTEALRSERSIDSAVGNAPHELVAACTRTGIELCRVGRDAGEQQDS